MSAKSSPAYKSVLYFVKMFLFVLILQIKEKHQDILLEMEK